MPFCSLEKLDPWLLGNNFPWIILLNSIIIIIWQAGEMGEGAMSWMKAEGLMLIREP